MIKKRMLVALMAILVISVGLVACGPEEPSNPEPTTLSVSEPEVKPQEPVAEPEPTQKPEPEVTPEPIVEPEVTPEPEPEVTSEPEVPETQVAEPVTAVSIIAKVSGKHTIGEALSATDFTITVNMSDGSTIKNPAGWNANPLTLSSESTVITVTYNGLSTTVTVTASQPAQQPSVQESQPSVGEPPLPENNWPSTWNQTTYQARDDLYNYAIARGWYASTSGSGAEYSLPCVRKGEYAVLFDPEMGGFLAYGLDSSPAYEWSPSSLANAYTFIDTH